MLSHYVDSLVFSGGKVRVRGWMFHSGRLLARLGLRVETAAGTSVTPAKIRQERRDVFDDHRVEEALESGFSVSATSRGIPADLDLVAVFEDGGEMVVRLGRLVAPAGTPEFRVHPGARVHDVVFRDGARCFERFRHLPFVASTSLGAVMRFVREKPLPRAPLPEPVDLLVACFRIERFFESFFGSLLANTTSPYRLILVDDANPGDLHYNTLCDVAAKVPGSIVLRNETNMGFPQSISRAFRHSSGHFAMINADTELPPGWLERLMRPIFDHPDQVASTTPFTNAGEVASFPDLAVDNPMYLGLSTEALDRWFARLDGRGIEIDLLSGVGFCMGFNRRAVERLGFIDAEAFGRGYGEENDWSLRAGAAGWRNVLVPDLFVRHEHGACYPSEEKRALMKASLAVVVGRYPTYQRDIQDYYQLDPPLRLRQAIALIAACGESPDGAVLVVDHAMGGGAGQYRKDLTAEWSAGGRPVILALIERGTLSVEVVGIAGGRVEHFPGTPFADLVAAAPLLAVREVFVNSVVSAGDPLALIDAAAEIKAKTGARIRVACHEYYPICPSYTLLDGADGYCGLPHIETCRACLPAHGGPQLRHTPDGVEIGAWRKAWDRFLAGPCDEILCFSESSAALYARTFPAAADRIVVRPHRISHVTRTADLQPGKGLHVGVLGAIAPIKGAEVVRGLARLMAERGDGSRITVVGTIHGDLDPRAATVTGPYERDRVVEAVEASGAGLFLIPSLCPETFSYTAEELVRMGVPVAVFDMGALPERVRGHAKGRVLTATDAEGVLAELLAFHESLTAGG